MQEKKAYRKMIYKAPRVKMNKMIKELRERKEDK